MILLNHNDSLISDLLTPTGGSNLTFKVSFDYYYFFISNDYLTFVTLDHKTSLKSLGIFVAIANNTLYGLKLYIFLLCQKSLAYSVKIMFH